MTATTDESAFAAENVFGKGEPNTAYAQYFTGDSFLNNLVTDPECVVGVHNVTFAPGCRNNWHIHHATSGGGQVLLGPVGRKVRIRGVGAGPSGPDVRHRAGGGGAAHSTGTGRRRIGGITRKLPGAQHR